MTVFIQEVPQQAEMQRWWACYSFKEQFLTLWYRWRYFKPDLYCPSESQWVAWMAEAVSASHSTNNHLEIMWTRLSEVIGPDQILFDNNSKNLVMTKNWEPKLDRAAPASIAESGVGELPLHYEGFAERFDPLAEASHRWVPPPGFEYIIPILQLTPEQVWNMILEKPKILFDSPPRWLTKCYVEVLPGCCQGRHFLKDLHCLITLARRAKACRELLAVQNVGAP